MSPEVCMEKPYDSKADVWALGVLLYELITLKKPFEAEKMNELFQQIIKEPHKPVPEDTHTNLKMLISTLLNKEYNKRPNIFEFSRIPCINQSIKKFVEENNLQGEVINILDMRENQVQNQSA